MIPAPALAAWRAKAPWRTDHQVAQDLILSLLAIRIALHPDLKEILVWRGGTCLHKLHLHAPKRYSEDLDYVRRTRTGIGSYLDALRELAADVGLEVQSVEQKRTFVATSRRLSARAFAVSEDFKR